MRDKDGGKASLKKTKTERKRMRGGSGDEATDGKREKMNEKWKHAANQRAASIKHLKHLQTAEQHADCP